MLTFSHHNSVWDTQKPPDIKFEVDSWVEQKLFRKINAISHPTNVKIGGEKNYMKSFFVVSGSFFVPGYTNVSQRVLEIIPKN